jgi:hypothetical protein
VAHLGDFGKAALRRGALGRPLHYRTPRVNFLETADAFLEQIGAVERPDGPVFETAQVSSDARAIVPAAP